MRDKFIHLELSSHIIIHQVWQLATAFDTAKCAALPNTASDKLECYEKGY